MNEMEYYLQSRPEMFRLVVGRPERVLEIGCAAGNFKRNFTWPCEYHGVEPVAAAARKAEANGIAVHVGIYDDVVERIPDGYFDLVVCNDVIEHMPNPAAFLLSVKDKLRSGGRLIGAVPNVRHNSIFRNLIFRRDWPYADSGILDRTHLRFFTMKSLRRLFDETGWNVECLKPSNTDSLGWLKKLLAPLLFPVGGDVLYMQIAFRVCPRSAAV